MKQSASSAMNPLYYGLDKTSYGSLAKYQDNETNVYVNPPSCDPPRYSDTAELARQITGVIAKPLDPIGRFDETVRKEELQNYFLLKSDPGHPTVALLERDTQHIVFWYHGDLIILSEAENAAKAFCQRENKQALYEGSSRKCEPIPEWFPVPTVNGRRLQTQHTLIISSFQCVGSLLPNALTTSPASSADRTLIRNIQSELKQLKLLTGAADGKLGPQTAAAIRSFQKKKGMLVDGTPSPLLLDALKADYSGSQLNTISPGRVGVSPANNCREKQQRGRSSENAFIRKPL